MGNKQSIFRKKLSSKVRSPKSRPSDDSDHPPSDFQPLDEYFLRIGKQSRDKSLTEVSTLLLCGYFRAHCRKMSEPGHLAQDIIAMCLLFYSLGDQWDLETTDSRLVVDQDAMIVSKTTKHDISRFYAFGKDQVQRNQKRRWRLKILRSENSTPSLSIGIIDVQKIQKTRCSSQHDWLYENSRYKLMTGNGNVCDGDYTLPYCPALSVGDVVQIELDLTKPDQGGGKVTFTINDRDCGLAWKSIDVRRKYSLCIAISRFEALQVLP